MSYSLELLEFSEGYIGLNDGYKKHYKITTVEQEAKEIERLRGFVLRPMMFNQLVDKSEVIKLWVFSLMDYEKIYSLLQEFNDNNKKAFTYLAKNPRLSLGQVSDKQKEKLQELIFCNYYYNAELAKELKKLDLAYAARQEFGFSYMNKANNVYQKEISEHFLSGFEYAVDMKIIEKISLESYGYDQLTGQLYRNMCHLNKALKRFKHLGGVLKNLKGIRGIAELFNKPLPSLYPKESKSDTVLDFVLEDRKRKVLSKYMTEEIMEEKNKLYMERFKI